MKPTLPRFAWGKSQDGEFHHLVHHCADVAACFEALAAQPVIRRRLERAAGRKLTQTDIARLCVLVFLHDVGKLHPGFQAKGWPHIHDVDWHGHSGEGLAIFCAEKLAPIRAVLPLTKLVEWGDPETLDNLLHAVFAHHGRPLGGIPSKAHNGWNDGLRHGYHMEQEAVIFGNAISTWFAAAFAAAPPLPDRIAFQHIFAGLVALADWLGSDQKQFAFVAAFDPFYMERARQRAGKCIREAGFVTASWRHGIGEDVDFAEIAPNRRARAAQSQAALWPLDDPLVILEAETGSGKTEAAIWRFARLFAAQHVDALYFAVPTRAAAMQLHGRIHAAMRRLFGDGGPETILALPGYIKAGDAQGQSLPGFKVLWDDNPDETKLRSRWAAESARRYLAAPIAVGTIDQAMLGAMQVKHAHLRSAALARALLVVDEVHASDRFMSDVQTKLLDTHLERGGHAMLMSATLGSSARNKWLRENTSSQSDMAAAIATPYPAVWGKRHGMRAVDDRRRQKMVNMELAATWTGAMAAGLAIEAARAGARVLVIRNTVKAALETFQCVLDRGETQLLLHVAGRPALHHSRFAVEDRALLDRAAETALSPDMKVRGVGGMIVIGTQTLEQSLDICADHLITDLCPADVLLQRIGRLHRHPLKRPEAYAQPSCMVLTPEGGLDRFAGGAFDNGLGKFRDGGGIYVDLHACELTRRLIERHPVWTIPAMNRMIVEQATHDEARDALSEEKGGAWRNYAHDLFGKALSEGQLAQNIAIDTIQTPFSKLNFPGVEEAIRTRLGGEGARLTFTPGSIGPFANPITALTLPAHWHVVAPEEPIPIRADENGAFLFSIDAHRFSYGASGLSKSHS